MAKNKLPKVLSREEISRLMAVPNPRYPTGLRNRVILQVLYRAGLRRSEVTNLTPADVNLEQSFLYIQDSKGGRDRYVPLDPETIAWLKKWEEIRPDCEYYFSSMNGRKLEDTYLLHMLYRFSEKSGVYIQNGRSKKRVTPHVLRHTYATELLEEGFGIHEVQQLLGHSSIQTTAIYAHVRPLRLAEKIRARGVKNSNETGGHK